MRFVTDYLLQSAERLPEKVAVVDERQRMTYAQMLQEAECVGVRLLGLPKAPVVLWLGREARSIAASQGVSLSGRPYAPLDIAQPPRRMKYMLELLQPAAVIVDEQHRAEAEKMISEAAFTSLPQLLVYEEMIASVPSEAEKAALGEAAACRLPQDACCLLFTSGSTGRPKCVAVSHELICGQINENISIFGLDESQVRAGQVPLYFTMAAYDDVYSVMATGGRLLLLSSSYIMFPRKIMPYLRREGANTVFWVPSMMRLMLDAGALKLPQKEMPDLGFISFAGEPMPPATLEAWKKCFPEAKFVNRFGTTEIGLASFSFQTEGKDSMALGKPIPGQRFLLLDEAGREVTQPGEVGELCLQGHIALGYWGEPELTAKAFVDNPLQAAYPERIYRTGDLVRLAEGGDITYLSRRDNQIKHHGYRIELGEIETTAAEIPGLRAACLHDSTKDELVLFYAGELDSREIKEELSSLLPRYMWPARLEKLEAMPYTGSGKIDRQALKALI